MANNPNDSVVYSEKFEELLKSEAEKAEVMSILHNKAYLKFNKLSIITNIPVIIISSLIGFLSPIELFNNQSIFLGAMSVFCGMIKTLDNYMDFTKKTQAHYMVSLSYNKISKFIQIQLSLEQECRIRPNDLLNMITNDLQNIRDSEPYIPKDIIMEFNQQYPEIHIEEQGEKKKTARPPITNGLTYIEINRNHIKEEVIEDKKEETKIEFADGNSEINIEIKPDLNVVNLDKEEKPKKNKPRTTNIAKKPQSTQLFK